MRLSEHFTLEEFTTTIHRNIDNTPTQGIIEQLSYTARCLEAVRMLLGAPITINSGYRSPLLNKTIGGALKSQHILGQAVDFTCKGYIPDEIVKKIIKSDIKYDQLIREYDSWVHISFVLNNPRKQNLIIDKKGTRPYES